MASDRLGGIKLKQLNTRRVVFERSHFRKLAIACSKALIGMAEYHPSKMDTNGLRSHFNELYAFVKSHLSDEYQYDFEVALLYGATITNCDLVQGLIDVTVSYTYLGNPIRFCLQCSNDHSPYGKEWPVALKRHGGDPGNYAQKLSMV